MHIYLDFNASTPIAPEVAAVMRPFLDSHFGNPSSGHWAGQPARDAVETARREIASLLQCDADEVLLTSGGSEANNHVIKGTVFGASSATPHLITTRWNTRPSSNPVASSSGSVRGSPPCRSTGTASSTQMTFGARSRPRRSSSA